MRNGFRFAFFICGIRNLSFFNHVGAAALDSPHLFACSILR